MAWTKVANLTPPTGAVEPYVRPTDWLPLPAVAAGEDKFVGLHAVFPHESNYVAFTTGNAVTIDWGDGSALQNMGGGGLRAEHLYTFSAIPSGTLTSRGYRQVIITVTPQAAAIGYINMAQRPNAISSSVYYATGWLDIRMGGSASRWVFSAGTGLDPRHNLLERVEYVGLNSGTAAQFTNHFSDCTALRKVILDPNYFSIASSVSAAFNNCYSLQEIPGIDVANATAFNNMFLNCYSLAKVPPLNTVKATNCTSMFKGCSSLRETPSLSNTALVTDFSAMFQDCASLKHGPSLNTINGTTFSNMFNGCSSIQSVEPMNTSKGTAFLNIFTGCAALKSAPLLDTALCTAFTGFFQGCTSLTEVPLLNTSNAINASSMFSGCNALQSIPAMDFAKVTTIATPFSACYSLSSVLITGMTRTVSFLNCRLSVNALNTLYTNLGTASAQTITVTGNVGISGDNPAIATAKGWTVTGS